MGKVIPFPKTNVIPINNLPSPLFGGLFILTTVFLVVWMLKPPAPLYIIHCEHEEDEKPVQPVMN